MEQFEMANGYARITSETIEFDKDRLHPVRQSFQRSRVVPAITIFGLLYLVAIVIFLPEIVPWRILFGIGAVVSAWCIWQYVNQRWRMGLTTDKCIDCDAVECVVYGEGGRIKQPDMGIVYRDDGERDVRQVVFPPGFLGGQDDLEDAITAFRSADIEVKSAAEVEDT
jgi:hypothetical protein